LEVFDNTNARVSTNFSQLSTSTAAFAVRVPANAVSGDYTLRVSSIGLPAISRSVRVIDYSQRLQVIVSLARPNASFVPGDRVTGRVTVRNGDGSAFVEEPTFSLSANFRAAQVSLVNQRLNIDGNGLFSFDIPRTANVLDSEIVFTARSGANSGIIGIPVKITTFQGASVDFYTETGYLAQGLPTRIFFQAWANPEKTLPFDFTLGQLKQRTVVGKITTDTILIPIIQNVHRGKGSFELLVQQGATYILDLTAPNGELVSRNLVLANPSLVNQNTEVSFRLNNPTRVLNPTDNLEIQITTNANVNGNEPYLIQIKARDAVVYSEQIILSARSTRNITIQGSRFPLVNGGVLSLNLYRLTADLNTYAENPLTQSVVVTGPNGSNTTTMVLLNAPSATVQRWMQPKGEILFYKRPDETLVLSVKTNKRVYSVGERVDYEVSVRSSRNGLPVTTDAFVSISATETSNTASNIAEYARVMLGGEITPADLQQAADYILPIFGQGNTNTRPLDLVLATQGWRVGAFDLGRLEAIARTISTLSQNERESLQQLYGFPFVNQSSLAPLTITPSRTPASFAFQASTTPAQDFVGNVANPRAFAKALRAGFNPTQPVDRTQTLLFQTTAVARAGVLRGSFFLSDSTTNFTISAEAFNAAGKYGLGVSDTFASIETYQIQYDLPAFIVEGDSLTVPVTVLNNGVVALPSRLVDIVSDPALRITFPLTPFNLAIGGRSVINVRVDALRATPSATIGLQANATVSGVNYTAARISTIKVLPRLQGVERRQVSTGFLVSAARNLRNVGTSATVLLDLPVNYLNASSSFQFTLFGSRAALYRAALNSPTTRNLETAVSAGQILLMNHALLASQPATVTATPGVQAQLADSIARIEENVASIIRDFRNIQDGGFRLNRGDVNSSVAFSALTFAYLTDVARISSTAFAPNVTASLRLYILGRRNGMGGFNFTRSDLPAHIQTAYVVYQLTLSGAFAVTEFNNELIALRANATAQIASGTQDAYFFALLSGAYYNIRRAADGTAIADQIQRLVATDGTLNRTEGTITRSRGSARVQEITALASVVFANNAKYLVQRTAANNYLLTQVSDLAANRQAVLTFRALDATLAANRPLNGAGRLQLIVNGTIISNTTFSNTTDVAMVDFTSLFTNATIAALFGSGNRVNITVALTDFTLNRLETVDFRALYALSHTFIDNGVIPSVATPVVPRVGVSAAIAPRANLATAGRTVTYQLSLNNTENVTENVGITLRYPSCLVSDLNNLNSLVASGALQSYFDEPSEGRVTVFVNTLPQANANIPLSVNFVSRWVPSVVTPNPSCSIRQVSVTPVGSFEATTWANPRLA
jgi:hypothetical protein